MKTMKNSPVIRFSKKFVLAGALALAAFEGASVHAANLLKTNGLVFPGGFAAPTGTLDITNQGLIVYSVSGVTVANMMSVIGFSWNGGAFDMPGLTSSTALNDPNFATTLGTADNTVFAYTDFYGNAGVLNGTDADVITRYTYYGDADLTGSVNGDDFDLFLLGKTNQESPTWAFGDFNYDTFVNGDDFDLFLLGKAQYDLDGPLNFTSGSGKSPGVGAVPEPGVASFLLIAALGAFSRRQRKQSAVKI